MASTIFLRLHKRVRIPKGRAIRLRDVAKTLSDPEFDPALEELVLHRPARGEGNLVLVDILKVIETIRRAFPDAHIEHFGDPHTLVEIVSKRKPANRFMFVIAWALLFFGSGLAIMNFHEDVSMPEVHRRIVTLVTGEEVEHPYVLQIPYSIGIGLGMIIFFNHVFKTKINEEPSPLEVEMHKYEESVMQYVIKEEYERQRQSGDTRS